MKSKAVSNSKRKREYHKPVLQKQEMFERFTLACVGTPAKATGACAKPGS
jgi:hypothetical protein